MGIIFDLIVLAIIVITAIVSAKQGFVKIFVDKTGK